MQQRLELVEKRTEKLEASTKKNSQNSSKPPSSDSPFNKQKKKTKKSKRKRGGQKGHKDLWTGTLLTFHFQTLMVKKPDKFYRPMSFSPIGRGWQPRASFGGTYDQNWQDNIFPFLPPDFDVAFFQAAPKTNKCITPKAVKPWRCSI
jgi:hypothetical protein